MRICRSSIQTVFSNVAELQQHSGSLLQLLGQDFDGLLAYCPGSIKWAGSSLSCVNRVFWSFHQVDVVFNAVGQESSTLFPFEVNVNITQTRNFLPGFWFSSVFSQAGDGGGKWIWQVGLWIAADLVGDWQLESGYVDLICAKQ